MIVDKAALNAALAAVHPVTRGNKTIPILTHIAFLREQGSLIVRGTNLDQEIRVRLVADFDDGFEDFACPADELHQFAKIAPGAEIQFELARSAGKVTAVLLSSGKSKLRLMTLPPVDMPTLETGPLDHGFTVDGGILSKALKAVIYAAETNISRPFLMGALLEPSEDGLVCVATDGGRLERRLIPSIAFDESDDITGIPRTIIPTGTVNRLIAMMIDGESVNLQLSTRKLRAVVGDVTILAPLLDGVYPEYGRIIPDNREHHAKVPASSLRAAITRVLLALPGKRKSILFKFGDNAVSLWARDATGAEGEDEIAAEADTSISIGFNGEHLSEMLERWGNANVSIMMSDPQTAGVLHPAGEPQNFSVIAATEIWGRTT